MNKLDRPTTQTYLAARRVVVRDLELGAKIGIYTHERLDAQLIRINISLDVGTQPMGDRIEDAVDYADLKLRIMHEVETSQYFLLEKLASRVLEIVAAEPKVRRATVEIDKPAALRFADSVSVSCSFVRKE